MLTLTTEAELDLKCIVGFAVNGTILPSFKTSADQRTDFARFGRDGRRS
jgi:hypothetical protein